jgi:hypothetical protein
MDDAALFSKMYFATKKDVANEATEGARVMDGRYVVRLETEITELYPSPPYPATPRIKVMRVKDKNRAKEYEVKAAIRALFLSDARWRGALDVGLSVEIPHLDTRDRPTLIKQVGGLIRLAEYAKYMTAFHPRHVIYLAARLTGKGYAPQPVWKGSHPPNAHIAPSSADLLAWDDHGAGDKPGPRLRRFPPTLYGGDRMPQTARTVATLALPIYERLVLVSEGPWSTRPRRCSSPMRIWTRPHPMSHTRLLRVVLPWASSLLLRGACSRRRAPTNPPRTWTTRSVSVSERHLHDCTAERRQTCYSRQRNLAIQLEVFAAHDTARCVAHSMLWARCGCKQTTSTRVMSREPLSGHHAHHERDARAECPLLHE